MGGVFPGAPTLDDFWKLVEAGRDTCGPVPPGRWLFDPAQIRNTAHGVPDAVFTDRGCFIEGFTPNLALTGLPREVAATLDPAFHLLLAAGHAAFAQARTATLDRGRMGVIIGSIALPTSGSSVLCDEVLGPLFVRSMAGGGAGLDAASGAGRGADSAARDGSAVSRAQRATQTALTNPLNRYVTGLPAAMLGASLGFGSGCYGLDAACASSLYAVKLACDELLAGRADAMLAGGLSRPDSLYTQMGFSQLRALSPSGRCSPFDVKGDGLIVGEGAGIVVLKRLDDALRDGDHILAVIRGAGLSNDTEGNLLAPSSEGQLRALRMAYDAAGWSPDMVDLIECHATGTPVGDAVEFNSLAQLWQRSAVPRTGAAPCVLSAVKSNIGHLLTAAGSAGLIKTLMAMQRGTLPPVANFEQASDKVRLADSPFAILQKSQAWERRAANVPRRAAINGFGFGGINAHLLIEEWLGEASLAMYGAATPPRSSRGSAVPFEMPSGVPSEVSSDVSSENLSNVPAASALPSTEKETHPEPIAIIGMGVRTGHCADLQAFTQRVLDSDSTSQAALRKVWRGLRPEDLASLDGADDADAQHDSPTSLPGYYLDDLAVPIDRFHIAPRELAEMLPQQLLMLDVAKSALDDAGSPKLDSSRSGVFIGLGLDLRTTDFHFRWSVKQRAPEHTEQAGLPLNADRTLGALGGIVASRVAREFHIGGPSHTICSEDTSGLRALDVAVRALQRGELDVALAGAVDLNGDLRSLAATDALRAYSRTGVARPFDADADGAVPGEGAACVVLKRLADAERAGDRIYAVVRGVGAATGTQADNGLSFPSSAVIEQALARAYADAGVAPSSVQLIEAHGSGTPQEDAAEADAFATFFGGAARAQAAHVSSAKADVGHTGAACGLVSLVKASLCLHHENLPGLRNLRTPSATLAAAPDLLTPRQTRHWVRNRIDGPRRAGVSAMSAEGGCMHVVLDAHEPVAAVTTSKAAVVPAREALFFLSAESAEALRQSLHALERMAHAAGTATTAQLAQRWWQLHSAARTQAALTAGAEPHRAALLVRDTPQLLRLIHQAAAGDTWRTTHGVEDRERVFTSRAALAAIGGVGGANGATGTNGANGASSASGMAGAGAAAAHPGRIAFVFPGTGNQFEGMGLDLARQWPQVLRVQDAENQRLAGQMRIGQFWNGPLTPALLSDHRALISGQVAFGTLVADLAQRFGLRPSAAIGYSLGESTALFALRAWRRRDAMLERLAQSSLFARDLSGTPEVLRERWQLPPQQAVEWVTGMVDRPADQVRAAIGARKRVYVLIVNTPDECVIGGDRVEVDAVVAALGCHWFALQGVGTVHCELAHAVRKPYRALHHFETAAPADVEFYSCAWGRAYTPDQESAADAIEAQALGTVDFPRVIRAAYAAGVQTFIEIGPGNSCSRMIGKILAGRPHFARSLAVAGQPAVTHFLRTLGQLFVEGVPVQLDDLFGAADANARGTDVDRHAQAVSGPPKKMVTVSISGAPFRAPVLEKIVMTPTPRTAPGADPRPVPASNPLPEPVLVMSSFATPAYPEGVAAPVAVPAVSGTGRFESVLLQAIADAEHATHEAHEAYLRFSQGLSDDLARAVSQQVTLLNSAAQSGFGVVPGPSAYAPASSVAQSSQSYLTTSAPPAERAYDTMPFAVSTRADGVPTALNRAACLEFGRGLVGRVLGAKFAAADAFPTRVRLPDEPLMLVDRITYIEGDPLSMTRGRLVTEHDIHDGAWYLDCGRIPTCIAVEAGQADLFLSGYLGIDFETQGRAMYRLLDAKVCFHRGLPGAGMVIRYDIRIDHFFRQGDTWLFKFNFEATVNGEPLLSMTDGCAGFFTQAALAAGKGIVRTTLDLKPVAGKRAADWRALAGMGVESYTAAQLDALRAGDFAACFGDAFAHLPVKHPVTLPGGNAARMKLVHRIPHLDPTGGRFGLGLVRGEADIHADDWFLTCHFVDDRVMPGTLMFECCLHTLRVFLLRQGWIAEQGQVALEPVPGVASQLKCRGQVQGTTRVVTYEVSIKELGYGPEPYVIADALMYADGKPIVEITNMSLRYAGVTRAQIEALWDAVGSGIRSAASAAASAASGVSPVVVRGTEKKPALYTYEQVLAYATGSPSEAFGAPYKIFDEGNTGGRVIARLPGPPFQFIDRITAIDCEPWKIVAGGSVEAQYDVPPDAWYFADNRQGDMPFAVLLEIALQPCGWLAAYMGSALTSDIDISFRNLGGTATQVAPVWPDVGTLTIRVKLTKASSSAGMIIQFFDYEVLAGEVSLYKGDTYFGFFPKSALEKQEGLKDAKRYQPDAQALACARRLPFPSDAPLPTGRLRLLDEIAAWMPDGGPASLGFIRATRRVMADEWFFKAHFYQDPVVPGSLGLESFLQLLKFVAMERWRAAPGARIEAVACGERHEWTYRGQVIPADHEVTVEAVVTTVDEAQHLLRADGFLIVDGRVIYAMKNFTVRQVLAH